MTNEEFTVVQNIRLTLSSREMILIHIATIKPLKSPSFRSACCELILNHITSYYVALLLFLSLKVN